MQKWLFFFSPKNYGDKDNDVQVMYCKHFPRNKGKMGMKINEKKREESEKLNRIVPSLFGLHS